MNSSHALAQFYEHLVERVFANDAKPGELEVENDINGGSHDEREADKVDPTAGLAAWVLRQLELVSA